MTAPKPSPLPWWLESGPETCPFCEIRVHLEATYHCPACDQPICTTCAVTVFKTRQVLCPDCHSALDRS
jgi:hypothetical protein